MVGGASKDVMSADMEDFLKDTILSEVWVEDFDLAGKMKY